MEKELIKKIDNHRRMNEIGGILFGLGIGLLIANTPANPVLDILKTLFLADGLIILVFEQQQWNKIKKK